MRRACQRGLAAAANVRWTSSNSAPVFPLVQAVGNLESLELKQLKRVLLHDIAQEQVAARPETKRHDSPTLFVQEIDIETSGVSDAVAPTSRFADDIERARSMQLVRLLRSEIALQQVPGANRSY